MAQKVGIFSRLSSAFWLSLCHLDPKSRDSDGYYHVSTKDHSNLLVTYFIIWYSYTKLSMRHFEMKNAFILYKSSPNVILDNQKLDNYLRIIVLTRVKLKMLD